MSQLTVKRLIGTDQLLECFEISKIKNKVGGSTPPSADGFIAGYTPYFENNDDRYVLGCFEDEKLISWIAIGFVDITVDGQDNRFWAISALYTTKFVQLFSFNNPEIGLLIKEAFQLAESKKFYQYYYSVSKRIQKVYETQIQKTKYIPIGRYDYFEVAVVPANTQPDNVLHWRLMGQTLKPDDIIIKKRILRSEYR
jgi:hypothetical protein